MRGACPAFTRASQNVVAVATVLDMLLAPSADVVDMIYYQQGRDLRLCHRTAGGMLLLVPGWGVKP
jgi:hypothetical protein